MEYDLNEKWEGLTSPVANRFITSYDESNSKLTSLRKFFHDLNNFDSDLILLSGLHLLETQSTGFITAKIAEMKEGLEKIPEDIPVHLELASMASEDLVKAILDQVRCQCYFFYRL